MVLGSRPHCRHSPHMHILRLVGSSIAQQTCPLALVSKISGAFAKAAIRHTATKWYVHYLGYKRQKPISKAAVQECLVTYHAQLNRSNTAKNTWAVSRHWGNPEEC